MTRALQCVFTHSRWLHSDTCLPQRRRLPQHADAYIHETLGIARQDDRILFQEPVPQHAVEKRMHDA